ncbi:hypothetical protein F8M41_026163 [Gigaspora margarita]|uniref:Uncharacterized protein n=1 Tax=Gigaspora margarita TaxID=4874 RepID=A0A8H3XHZ8_GIGMA|nr:hypothetical protein F8M41_026163 [Gigaspora margarita]
MTSPCNNCKYAEVLMWPDIGNETLAVAVDLLTLPKFFMRPDIGGVLLPLHLRRRHNFMRPDIGDKTMSQWISKLSLGSRQPLINQSLCQEKLMHNSFTMYTHD